MRQRAVVGWISGLLWPLLGAAAEPYTYVHHPVSTDRVAAQEAFDRGLTMIYAYAPDEAQLSFELAAKLDPSLAMAWWGIALAHGPNINNEPELEATHQAAEALRHASELARSHATAEEQAYIAALSTRYSSEPQPDFDQLAANYRDAMRALVAAHPEDADAGALYAEALMDLHPWRLWSNAGAPAPGTEELVSMLEAHLARAPTHIGLMHLYIHAVEASPHPERALEVAHRLGGLAMEPAAAHLVHMPAHIYLRVGDWAAAIEANEHSVHHALDYRHSAYPADQQACAHCLDFLAYAYAMAGDLADARMAAEHFQVLWEDPTDLLAVLARFRQWSALLQLPEPTREPQPRKSDVHFAHGFWHYARGVALAATAQPQQAEVELAALRAEAAQLPPRFTVPAGTLGLAHTLEDLFRESDQDTLALADAVLSARIAEARGQHAVAIAHWREAVRLQDHAAYSEPPLWYYPVRDSLGAALLRSGEASEALTVFNEDLQHTPHNARAYLGLAAAYGALHQQQAARAAEAQYRQSWQLADGPLTLADL
jgi:tetratricopeptide (TPR) repeat protein